jgi:hypothetical protein
MENVQMEENEFVHSDDSSSDTESEDEENSAIRYVQVLFYTFKLRLTFSFFVFYSSFIQELNEEIGKCENWIPDDMKMTLKAFMKAVEDGFKTGFSAEDGETTLFLDYSVNALADLMDSMYIYLREIKKGSLTSSLNNIKRMFQAESLDHDQIHLEVDFMEERIWEEENTVMNLKRERSFITYHKHDNEQKKRRLDHDIERKQQAIGGMRKKLEKIQVS